MITADISKFFDSFDPQFFYELLIAVGIPERVAKQIRYMYVNIKRMVKLGEAYGQPFTGKVGAGQGDVLAVFKALAITTVQFTYIS